MADILPACSQCLRSSGIGGLGTGGGSKVHVVLGVVIGCLVAIVLILADIARTLDAIRQHSY